jgi:tetratricopeptide (TPR) repeat protein
MIVKIITRFILLILFCFMIVACNTMKQVDLEVEVNVRLDGKPAPHARVFMDGTETGSTDTNGHFLQRLKRQPGEEVQLSVQKETDGYKIEKWEHSFVIKLPEKGVIQRYPFQVNLKATKYFTVIVADNESGEPLEEVTIQIANKERVKTDENGEVVYDYTAMPEKGFKLRVAKQGYSVWQKLVRVIPGQRFEISLRKEPKKIKKVVANASPSQKKAKKAAIAKAPAAQPSTVQAKPAKPKVKKATISISAQTDAYGIIQGIPGVVVMINGKSVGKTNAKGEFIYVTKAATQREAELKLSAPGYIPDVWETKIPLQSKSKIQRYFYPTKPKPIRVGLYGFVSNSPDEDLSEVTDTIEEAIGSNLYTYSCFQEVPKPTLREMMLQAGLDMETISTKGWQKTPLVRSVDMIISGSVTKDNQAMTIETSVITADGNVLFSQLNKARKKKNIRNTAQLIANSIIDQFPFEGTIAAVDDQGYRINLGKSDYKVRRGNEFRFMSAEMDRSGRVMEFHEAGTLRVIETDDSSSWTEIVALNETAEIKIGDRVIRRIYLDERRETDKASIVISATGGIPPDDKPLWGVNVYLDNTWVGSTGSKGQVEIPANLYEEYDILLSRHGYQPINDTISVDKDKQTKEFFLEVANAFFKVESQPSDADVYVDGVKIGKTPILDGKSVNFGFRKIKLSIGGEYRDWEAVIEFNKPEVELIGADKIVFLKDWFKIGKTAEQNGKIDAAIQAYSSCDKANPDYSDARHRLAQLYMDEKKDYAGAIREFENVLSLPENQQIIYKQFAVTYTNLGHAYYEKGVEQLLADKRTAAKNFAAAIKNLNIAKQNTRFFPNHHFDEAVHDTYYYLALSYHKLFMVTKKKALIEKTNLAWREYFDFFPKNLERKSNFVEIRNAAQKYWDQIRDLS